MNEAAVVENTLTLLAAVKTFDAILDSLRNSGRRELKELPADRSGDVPHRFERCAPLRAIVETDVPAFNALVRERDVPALIVPERPR